MRNVICTEFRSAGVFPHENGGQSLGMLTFEYMLYPFKETLNPENFSHGQEIACMYVGLPARG